MSNFIIKRIGLLIYGTLSILESVINTVFYITFLDVFFPPIDMAFPVYFKYVNKFLKGAYLTNLKTNGKDI